MMSYPTPPLTPTTSKNPGAEFMIRPKLLNLPTFSQLPTPPLSPDLILSTPALEAFKRLSFDQSDRSLSENELSYYLPSRADGVNDMCVFRYHPCRSQADDASSGTCIIVSPHRLTR